MLKPSLEELVNMSYSAPNPKTPVQRPDGIRISSPITRSTTASALQCGLRVTVAVAFGSDIDGPAVWRDEHETGVLHHNHLLLVRIRRIPTIKTVHPAINGIR